VEIRDRVNYGMKNTREFVSSSGYGLAISATSRELLYWMSFENE